MRKILLILTSVLLLAACEQQSDLVTILEIDNVNWQQDAVESGFNLHIKVKAAAKSSTIQRLIIYSDDNQFKERILLDSTIAIPAKNINLSWYYTLPYYTDTTKVKLTARSYDQSGNTMSGAVIIRVAPGDQALRSIDNLTLYSALSDGKSAFSFETFQPVYIGKDTTKVAFFDWTEPAELEGQQSTAISREWHSEIGLLFSRSEGFNFSEATAQSVTDVWKSAVKSAIIKSLRADDVLLIGIGDKPVGAIKILAVYDDEGTENDRYIFSIKVLPDFKWNPEQDNPETQKE